MDLYRARLQRRASFHYLSLLSHNAGDESVPEVAVTPPASYIFSPHYCQFVYPSLGINNERNLGPIVVTKFQKYHDHTVLKITWEGNFRSDISSLNFVYSCGTGYSIFIAGHCGGKYLKDTLICLQSLNLAICPIFDTYNVNFENYPLISLSNFVTANYCSPEIASYTVRWQ
jgi:hypothetical protein